MRDKLAPYLSQYVLCKGWIDDWEKIEDENYRVLIKQTTIKEPNKNVLFDDLKLISVEHHINLFLNPDDVKDGLKRLEEIYFTGNINRYRRSDGSYDYGIYPMKYSSLHNEIDALYEDMSGRLTPKPMNFATRENLTLFEFGYKPRLFRIEEKLEQSGNNLPTFYATYNQYKEMIEEVRDELLVGIKWIRGACSNRKFRRAYGIKENFAETIPTYEKYLEVLEKKDTLLKSKTG